MKIIGFGHRAQSGKDSSGEYLVKEFGFRRVAFADPLKRAAMEIFGFTNAQCYGTKADKETIDPRCGFTPRYALQTLGEKMRVIFGDEVWVKAAEAQIISTVPTKTHDTVDRVVITDVRYENEAAMIRRNGGVVVRIDRPSLGPLTDTHPSETSMEGFEYDEVIVNDGTIQDLYAKVQKIFMEYGTAE